MYSTRHSDIWSLGVILTNMISGRNPWRYATAKDECFAAYLHDEDFLRQVLPISHGANDILKRIFNINPLRRISLDDLRQEILILDTFFMTEDELSAASLSVRKVAKTFSEGKPQDASTVSKVETLLEGVTEDSDSSVSSDELYAFNSPPDDHPPPSALLAVPGVHVIGTSTLLNSSGETSSSSNSSADSDGPITPATRPIDPTIEVPELPEGQSLDDAALFTPTVTGKYTSTPSDSKIRKSTPSRKQLFRMAFERIKALSSGSGSS